jgi:hypothetical protein
LLRRRGLSSPSCAAGYFACRPGSAADLDASIDYTPLLAEHFLDAAPYNAAKHGMGLTGGSERRQIELDGVEIFRRDGAVINWLGAWPPQDPDHPAQWTRAARLFSPEAAIAVTSLATNLMMSIWVRGRSDHLDEPWPARAHHQDASHRLLSNRRALPMDDREG